MYINNNTWCRLSPGIIDYSIYLPGSEIDTVRQDGQQNIFLNKRHDPLFEHVITHVAAINGTKLVYSYNNSDRT